MKIMDKIPVGKKKNQKHFWDTVYMEDFNRRMNKEAEIYRFYQINPYTKKTVTFTTRKVNEKPPNVCIPEVPGYAELRQTLRNAFTTPMEKWNEPQTESQRYGWFESGKGYYDRELYDERFTFTHKTEDFIHTNSMIIKYDQLMKMFPTVPREKKVWRY